MAQGHGHPSLSHRAEPEEPPRRPDRGGARANWIGLEDLLAIKERIDHPRHREDARVLRKVLERLRSRERR